MKKIIFAGAVFSSSLFFSQIGIGTPNSRGALDINKEITNDMGLVLPTNSDVNNVVTPQGGNVIPGIIIYDSTKDCIRFYKKTDEWSKCISFSAETLILSSKPTITETKIIKMKKNLTLIIVFISILSYAQIGMGRTNPRGALDINKDDATNTMGLVLPTNSDVNNMINPLGGSVVPGTIMYDSTNDCVRFYKGANVWSGCFCEVSEGEIGSLNCDGATHIGTLASNTVASGVSSILSYTGGNGGTYDAQSITSTGVSGLTAILDAGSFANGNGTLTYRIEGTATASGTALFAINIGGQTCILRRTVNPGPPPTLPDANLNCVGWAFSGFGTSSGTVSGLPVSATVTAITSGFDTGGASIRMCSSTSNYIINNGYQLSSNGDVRRMRIKFNRKVSNIRINLSRIAMTGGYLQIDFKRDGVIVTNPAYKFNGCFSSYSNSFRRFISNISGASRVDSAIFGGQWFDEIEVSGVQGTASSDSTIFEFCVGAAQ